MKTNNCLSAGPQSDRNSLDTRSCSHRSSSTQLSLENNQQYNDNVKKEETKHKMLEYFPLKCSLRQFNRSVPANIEVI